MPTITFAERIITGCWLVFLAVWFIAAWFTKRTVESSGTRVRWTFWLLVVLLLATRDRWMTNMNTGTVWRPSPGVAAGAVAITIAGLGIALWARATLGGNWSGAIVLKEQHELIDRGPYAAVRHPIYTGVLLMVVGSVIVWGTRVGLVLLPILIAGFVIKARREERLLTKHFPEAYPHYRARVRAMLIPFVV